MSDYDLAAVIRRIKKSPFNFSLIKGNKADQVHISQKPLAKKLLDEILDECGDGKRLAKGLCMWENEQLTFATRGVPSPLWEKLAAKYFKDNHCAKYLPVVFRQLGGDESEEATGEESESQGEEPAGTAPATVAANAATAPAASAAGTADTGHEGEARQLMATLAKMTPLIQQGVAAHPERRQEFLAAVAGFQGFMKDRQLAQAWDTLLQLGRLLQSAKEEPAAGGTAPAGAASPRQAPAVPSRPLSPLWETTSEDVIDQTTAIIIAMRKVGDPELDRMADDMLEAVNGYLSGMSEMLEEYDQLIGEQRVDMAAEALGFVHDHRRHIAGDRLIAAADSNPFGIRINLAKTMYGTLDEIEAAFQA